MSECDAVLHYVFNCRDLEGPAQSLKSLLMKHTRVSTSASGLKVYSSRKILAR